MTSWKPELEDKVSDLQNSVFLLKQKVDCFIHKLPKTEKVKNGVPHGVSASVHLGASAAVGTSGPNGHSVDPSHLSVGAGVVTTPVPPPVTGAGRFANLTPIPFTGFDSVGSIQCSSLGGYHFAC